VLNKKIIFIIFIIVIYIITLNIVTTIRVLKSEYYTKIQKIIQIFLIWFLPIVGVTLVIIFLNMETISINKVSFSKKLFYFLFFIKIKDSYKIKKDSYNMNGSDINVEDLSIYTNHQHSNFDIGGIDGGGF